MAKLGETVVPFPSHILPIRHARSTVLLGSIDVLRGGTLWDDYVKALEPKHRDALLTAVAATWIPLEAAMAHYRACDTLRLSADEQMANGRKTFDRAAGTIFGTIMKMAKEAGVTPWTLFTHLNRFWGRSYDGGGVEVTRTGPKEALVEVVQAPFFESRYFRNAIRGVVVSAVDLFCTKAYVTERPGPRAPSSGAYRIQWA